MKKHLLLLVMILLPMVTWAVTVEIDGIYYDLVSKTKTAKVTKNPNQYKGSVIIPNEVNKKHKKEMEKYVKELKSAEDEEEEEEEDDEEN